MTATHLDTDSMERGRAVSRRTLVIAAIAALTLFVAGLVGYPACLTAVGSTVTVRFGEVPVAGPDSGGIGLSPVVWIDCRGAIPAH
jgi:hypothetical protein